MFKLVDFFYKFLLQIRVFGLVGFFRTIIGSLTTLIFSSKKYQNPSGKKIALITFSINPVFSQVWAYFAHRYTDENLVDIFIIDLSGNLHSKDVYDISVTSFLNIEHGKKIDLFTKKLKYEYIWLCDDDVFFSDLSTMQSLITNLNEDQLFAISLLPRTQKIKTKFIEQNAMGTYCVCFNREEFLKERFSFRPHKTSDQKINWGKGYYDTADYAQKQAIEKGYRVVIDELKSLQPFMGTSIVYLKMKSFENTANAFFSETLNFSDDWRRISGRIGSAFCLIKLLSLYNEIKGRSADWEPPFNETKIIAFTANLENIQAKERALSYIDQYLSVYEILLSIIRKIEREVFRLIVKDIFTIYEEI